MTHDISERLLENGEDQEEKERNFIIVEKEEKLKERIINENKKLWVVAGPAIFTRFSTFGVNVISLAFIGHIGATELAAYSLVFTVLLRFCIGILFKFGLSGAMISTILAFWIPNVGQLVFVMGGWCKDTWTGFTFLAFKDLWPVVKLSLSSGVMLCVEFWYNSILVLLTGNFKNAKIQIDALSICLNINGWEMMIALGFMNAACVRVANELGRGSSKAAKFSIMTIVLISSSIGFILFLFFFFLRGRLAYVFTKSQQVVEAVDYLSPLLAFSILLNSVQPVLSGVAVGAGWQSIVAYVNIGCYYLVGIPIGIMLGYVLQLQVRGVWIGMLIGTLVQTIVLVIITSKTDWDKQVTLTQQRVKEWAVEDVNNSTSQGA